MYRGLQFDDVTGQWSAISNLEYSSPRAAAEAVIEANRGYGNVATIEDISTGKREHWVVTVAGAEKCKG